MQAYISVSFQKRRFLDTAIRAIVEALAQSNIVPFVFVDQHRFAESEERQMMQQAFAEIDKSGLLVAEVSEKGIGVGVEVGYAIAKGKPVIYARHAGGEHSTTVSGASDFQIVYKDIPELKSRLKEILAIITCG